MPVCALHGVSPRGRWLCVLPRWQLNVNENDCMPAQAQPFNCELVPSRVPRNRKHRLTAVSHRADAGTTLHARKNTAL
jgi:hypothetical protein